jgi:hypothetical protein
MSHLLSAVRIPPEVLSEQWFGFVQGMIAGMQTAYREAQTVAPDFNQKILGQKIGKKASFISRCLSGQQNMTIRTIHDIARGMDCRLDVVLTPLWTLKRANRGPVEERLGGSAGFGWYESDTNKTSGGSPQPKGSYEVVSR